MIIGGGLIGMLTARFLAQAGAKVTIYEKGETGKESSWAGGGIISPLYPWRYDDAVTELALWGQKRYEALAHELHNETGIDPEYLHSGLLLLDIDAQERQLAEQWATRFGYRMEFLEEEGIRALMPNLKSGGHRGLWMPTVTQMRNPRLARALRKSIEKLGVTIREHHAVDEIKIEDGEVTGLVVNGEQHNSSQVIVAGGAWSGEILKRQGLTLPVEPVKGQMLLFKAAPELLQQIVLSGIHYLIPRADGRILAGSTLERVGFDKAITEEGRDTLLAFAHELLPALTQCPIEMQWSGLRPGTSDGIPFIGNCQGITGLYINAGHFRNGVVTGLASARLLADILLGRAPILPPEPYQCSV